MGLLASGSISFYDLQMPRRWVMWALFFSSYLPLFLLLGLRSIHHSEVVTIASLISLALGVIGTVALLRTAPSKSVADYRLLDVENRDGDVAAYAATYLLPFLVVFGGRWQDIASLAAFVVILGVVYVRSRLIYMNPTLALLGFRLWRVIPITAGSEKQDDSLAWPRFLLARTHRVAKDQVISARRITDDLLLFDSDRSDLYARF